MRVVGTQPAIGISPPSDALLFVICSPVGPYYPQGFKPVALYGTTEYTRAAPGGTFIVFLLIESLYLNPAGVGAYKLGANYAPALIAQKDAAKLGYVQNLWLHGPEHYITEVCPPVRRSLQCATQGLIARDIGRSAR